MIIRSARETDLDSLLNLSALLPPGMTSMPFDKHTWEKKLELVSESLRGESRRNTESVYLLVMEDPQTEKIVGTAGIVSGVGLTRPFYNYKLSKESKYSELLDLRVTSNLLNLVNDFTGETELISLFLLPDFREKTAGQFLSRCRYVFMSDFPERFSDIVFAEIRGWLDESENSPFWEHLGKKFFNLPFARADFISAVNGSQFISDLMPRFPVYQELLHEEAVAVIGKPHDDAVPARKLLEKEGFAYHGTIDVFDAGPVMECERAHINSIKHCSTGKITGLLEEQSEVQQLPLYIVSNRRLDDYRLLLSPVKELGGDEVALTSAARAALGVESGSEVQLLKIR